MSAACATPSHGGRGSAAGDLYCHDQYADLALGVVDASIVELAERLAEPKLATLGRRHFTALRPAHVEALELPPV